MRRLGVVLVLGLWIAGVPLRAAGDRDRLVGVWRFQKEVDTKLDGTPIPPSGPAYDGLLLYTADGFVSATLMPKGRRWSAATATAEELRATVAESTGYTGRFEVDSEKHTVTHVVMASLDPGDEGRRLVRSYAFEGDTLRLSGNFAYQGETLRFTVSWVRAR